MAGNIDEWLPETRKPEILKLVSVFFFAKILAATQDIAVDGWALTMLKKSVLLLTWLLFRVRIT